MIPPSWAASAVPTTRPNGVYAIASGTTAASPSRTGDVGTAGASTVTLTDMPPPCPAVLPSPFRRGKRPGRTEEGPSVIVVGVTPTPTRGAPHHDHDRHHQQRQPGDPQ